jgi:hypothetical protein
MAAHRNLGFRAKYSLFELQVDIFPEIGAPLGTAALPCPAAAKNFAQTKEVAKDIPQVGGVKALSPANPTQTGVAVTVVGGALVAVRQYGVGFAALLEFFFGVGIIGIAVGMELQREFAIGALDLLLSRPTLHTQYFVVVSFYARQGSLFSAFRLSF